MTWRSKNTRVKYIVMAMSFIVMVLFWRTAYSSLTPQAFKDGRMQSAASPFEGFEWDLTGIAAIDRHNVWVVGNLRSPAESVVKDGTGIVLTSSDGGQSWSIRRKEPGKHFCGVYFVDRMTGWVSDASDLIMKTTDSGYTWSTQTVAARSFWYNMQFVDSHQGWILGADGKILRTEDAGQKWTLIDIATQRDLFFLGFADARNGWIVGEKGAAYETTDAGTHWRSRGDELVGLLTNATDRAVSFRMVKFVDSNVGFIAADILSTSGAFNAQAVVFKTVDRGRTWTARIVPEALGIRSAAFLTDNEAWIIPGNRANTVIRHTENGGVNWTSPRLPHNSVPGPLVFVDSQHGWFLNSSDTRNSDQIFNTKDGGKTWVEIKISERIAPSSGPR